MGLGGGESQSALTAVHRLGARSASEVNRPRRCRVPGALGQAQALLGRRGDRDDGGVGEERSDRGWRSAKQEQRETRAQREAVWAGYDRPTVCLRPLGGRLSVSGNARTPQRPYRGRTSTRPSLGQAAIDLARPGQVGLAPCLGPRSTSRPVTHPHPPGAFRKAGGAVSGSPLG
jgi:hypothetical protein